MVVHSGRIVFFNLQISSQLPSKELNDIQAHVDCEDVPSAMTEGNDVKHFWIGLNNYFLASPKHALTFPIVGDFISASRRVHFIDNLGDRHM